MELNKLSVKIAGPAGEGILSAGKVLAKSFARGGLHVVTENERPSLVRGGHNQFMVRIEDRPITSHIKLLNILIALDEKSVGLHYNELHHKGAIIYDSNSFNFNKPRDDLTLVPVPMRDIANSVGAKPVIENAISLGACVALVDYNLDLLLGVMKDLYSNHPDLLEMDIKGAREGYYYVRKNFSSFTNAMRPVGDPKMLINGLEAFNLGAVKAGVGFVSQYPMTPSTGVIQGLAALAEKYRIAIVQSEDEIASLNLAIGASYAGVRALTATSGGGFALMNEALSLAGMTETGVVIVEVQRGGPATGLPTRTEQSDLKFVINSGHGEFPLVVIAPSDPANAFIEAQRAFNIAEKYQTPVVLLFDRYNSETYRTYDSLPEGLPIERGSWVSQKELDSFSGERFPRYEWSSNGVSKRSVPGMRNGMFVASGNEHDTQGLLNDDRQVRTRMMDKRLKKLNYIIKELPEPVIEGPSNAEITIVSFGSTKPIISAAREFLEGGGVRSNHLHLTYMSPFHSQRIRSLLMGCDNIVCVENNATGQLASLIKEQTGVNIVKHVRQYDGWPFAPEELAEKLKTLL